MSHTRYRIASAGKPRPFPAEAMTRIQETLKRYPTKQAALLPVRVEERDVRGRRTRAEDHLEPGPQGRPLASILGEAQDFGASGSRLRARRIRRPVIDDHDSLDERPSAPDHGTDRRLGLVRRHEGDGTKIGRPGHRRILTRRDSSPFALFDMR